MTPKQAEANRAALAARQQRAAPPKSTSPWVVCCKVCGYGHSAAIGCPHCHPLTLFGAHR